MAASSYQQQNGQVIGLGGLNNEDNNLDTKMLMVKKNGDNRITALINRQLQGNFYNGLFLKNFKFVNFRL